jgi:hypothetical protein
MGNRVTPRKVIPVLSVESATCHIRLEGVPRLFIRATGSASSANWSNGKLRPRIYIDYPPDGVQGFDFLATPPRIALPHQRLPILGEVTIEYENWMRGVRIYTATNQYEVTFQALGDVGFSSF